jgi:hypothetical protein
MTIAILGWGSLIWNAKDLNYNNEIGWIDAGPFLPIEFSRISKNRSLTLVISKDGCRVQTLYSLSNEKTINAALENLRKREGTNINNVGYYLKFSREFFPPSFEHKQNILDWIEDKDFDAVIWTDLKENWKDFAKNRIEYLKSLDKEDKTNAKKYIENAPKQIETDIRKEIREQLDWG